MKPQKQRSKASQHVNNPVPAVKHLTLILALSFAQGLAIANDDLQKENEEAAQSDKTSESTTETAAKKKTTTLPQVKVSASKVKGLTEGTGSYTTDSTNAATGLDLSLRETPQSVTVITRQRMDEQNLSTLSDVVKQTPGVFYIQEGSRTAGRLTMYARGFSITNFKADGVTILNGSGVHSTARASAFNTAAYDSVTVVRGAAGLLNGEGDPSASVDITYKRPTKNFQAFLEGGLGSWDRRRATADVGGPLNTSNSLRGRFVATHETVNSWVDYETSKNNLIYGVIEADIAPRTMLTISLENDISRGNRNSEWDQSSTFSDNKALKNFPKSLNFTPPWAYFFFQREALGIKIEHEITENWRTKFTYNFTRNKSRGSSIYTYYFRSDGFFTFDGYPFGRNINTNSFNANLNGHFTLWKRQHDLMLGFNAYHSKEHFFTKESIVCTDCGRIINGKPLFPPVDYSLQEDESFLFTQPQSGVFLSTRLHPTDSLSVIFGGRWGNWKLKGTYYFTDRTEPRTKSSYKDVFTPYYGAVYNFTNYLSAYASYTKIFSPQSMKDVKGVLLDPEEGISYEAGLKGEWFEGRLNTGLAAFKTIKDNLGIRDGYNTTPDGKPAFKALNKVHVEGFELEVAGELTRSWQLQGGYTHFITRDRKGKRIKKYFPINQFKLFTAYTPYFHNKLTVGGGANWNSKTSSSKIYSKSSYAIVNFMVHYDFSNQLGLTANLDNAFDKTKASIGKNLINAPRSLMVTLKYRF